MKRAIPADRNQPRFSVETELAVNYADIGGADEAKGELRDVVAFLKEPEASGRLGGRMPKALLLVGPPGTGKTLLARATAGEAKVPFLAINSAELAESLVEGGTSSIRGLFELAQRQSPAILFIDDIARLGCADESGPSPGRTGRGQLLNHLLIELDRLDSAAGLVILAATNRPDILDPALLRSGRFEPVAVPRPDQVERVQILQLHTRNIRMSADADLTAVAASTGGFTGADLARLVNWAALLATRRGAGAVAPSDFSAAIERILVGAGTKTPALNVHEREVLAYHEVGHALLALTLPGGYPVRALSMVARDPVTAGCSMQRPTDDRVLLAHQELENQLVLLLSGRAAEHLIFGEFSTLGTLDLQRATAIARGIAARYGMTVEIGQVNYEDITGSDLRVPREGSESRYSEQTARQIDCAVKSLIDRTFSRALELLRAQREVLERGARLLARNGILDAASLSALRQGFWSQSNDIHDHG